MEEGKEGEGRTLYGSNLYCALALLPVGLFVSLLNSSTRITGSALLGESLVAFGGWSHRGIYLGLRLLYWSWFYKDPHGSYVGTLRDCSSCAHLPGSLHSSVAWKGSPLFLLGRSGSQDP